MILTPSLECPLSKDTIFESGKLTAWIDVMSEKRESRYFGKLTPKATPDSNFRG